MAEIRGSQFKNGTADQLLQTGAGKVYGFTINSHTSGTIRLIDGLTAGSGRVIVNTITLAAGPQVWTLPEPAAFSTGLYVYVGGTIDYTIFWN